MLTQTLAGRYQIISPLGGGGFGTTFVAEDTYLPGKPLCVVKQLKPQATDPLSLQTARRLFDTEAQVLYQLGHHDQIPQLFAYFEENQEFYLVQEFVKGCNLSEEIAPGKRLSQDAVVVLLQNILEVLEFVHQQKVIHRDINPQNLLRRERDCKLVLIDFGAVKQIATQFVPPSGKTKLTIAIGTPGYIPSEQAYGNPRLSSDIYAVGVIGIQALTGLSPDQLPRDTDTNEIIWQDQIQVSPELAKVLVKMVLYDFRQRYPSASEALQALKDLSIATAATVVPTPLLTPPAANSSKNLSKLNLYKAIILSGLVGLVAATTVFVINTINFNNATVLYQQGNTLHDLKRYQEALAVYERAIQIRPDYFEAWDAQANTRYELKQYKEALDAYEKAIQIQPQYLPAWTGRGLVLVRLQQYEAAIDSFDRVLKIKTDDSEAWNGRGDALVNLQRYQEAVESYDKAIQFKPDDSQPLSGRGWALHNLKRYEDAIAAYDKVIEIQPDNSLAWYNRGNSLMSLQRYQDAVTAYDKAVQIKPNYYQAWYSRGHALVNLQRYPEAVTSFNTVVELQPNNYKAWYGRGWSLHQLQRYEEAIDSYDKAIRLKQNDYLVWYNRGNAVYNLRRYEDALAAYNRAVRYKPDHYESWYSRGNALFNLKRYQEAIASYDKAVRFKPDYQQAINARNQALQVEEKKLQEIEKQAN